MTAIGGHHSARASTDVWLTPPFVLESVGGWQSFDLDPCAPMRRPWPMARHHYTRADNGLLLPWFGRVWLNAPYGRVLGRWLGRMAAHNRGLALIFARTDTAAFFRHVWDVSTALLFLRGRLDFVDERGEPHRRRTGRPQNSGAPSVLCAYGYRDADVLASCGLDGQFVPLRLPRSVVALALPATWREEVLAWLRRHGAGPVALAELYRAFAKHPKSAGNPNYRAKIRQVLQQGPFRRVARGQWCTA